MVCLLFLFVIDTMTGRGGWMGALATYGFAISTQILHTATYKNLATLTMSQTRNHA